MAMRRTRIQDYTKIEEAKDLDSVVSEKERELPRKKLRVEIGDIKTIF